MADVPLKDKSTLSETEEATTIVGAVEDETTSSEGRKQTFAQRMESLHRQNTMKLVWEKVTLFSDRAVTADTTTNLNFKSGNSGPRHNFTDDYVFFGYFNPDNNHKFLNAAPDILESSLSEPIRFFGTNTTDDFAKISDTSFQLGSSYSSGGFTIVGYKLMIMPTTLI